MFGAIFYVYKKEVQKMNDLIELKLITREDAECLHKLQIEAFMPLSILCVTDELHFLQSQRCDPAFVFPALIHLFPHTGQFT